MSSKLPVILLALLAVALGTGLWLRHREAVSQTEAASAQIQRLSQQLSDEQQSAEASRAKSAQEAEALQTRLTAKNRDLEATAAQLAETKGSLEKVQVELSSTRSDLAAAQTDVAQKDTRIQTLQKEKDELETHSNELKAAIAERESLIAQVRRQLATSEGDRNFLLKELKRIQNEKADLERQFNDVLTLQEQVRKLKQEYSVAKRLEWTRRGLSDLNARKGGEVLQRGFATPTVVYTNSPDLEVEIRRDGSSTITPPK